MRTAHKIQISLEPDERGYWIVTVPSVPGCHTYGRSIKQAMRRAREALALFVEDIDDAELVPDMRLPRSANDAVRRSAGLRRQAELSSARAKEATATAARLLVQELQLGMRDTGELLGISHQRVEQLVNDRRTRQAQRRGGSDALGRAQATAAGDDRSQA